MTPSSANKIIALLQHLTVGELMTHQALDAFHELVALSQERSDVPEPEYETDKVDVYVYYDPLRKVDVIKTVRMFKGCGLKEAKDYVDSNVPHEWIGPVYTGIRNYVRTIEAFVPVRATPIS